MRRFSMLVLACAILGGSAFAQDESAALGERLERLERDLSFVQKQVYRNGSGATDASGAAPAVPMNTGQLQVRLSQMDEEIRKLHGDLEQVQFQNKQTAAEMKKLSEDVEYRLHAIEQKQTEAPAAAPVAAPAAAEPAKETKDTKPAATAADTKPANYQPESKEPKPALTGKDFPNANAHYSYAFKLMNEKKYADAAASFDTFVKKYPSDPLTSNAYYWLGESQYARSDYSRATESFRKGYEANAEGQKAPDNLYKLAMALSQTKRVSEACIVLGQVVSKYSETAARTAAKATEARTSLQCK